MSSEPDPAGEDDDGWALQFPFVACASNGGIFDDEAFVAGYQAGLVDAGLATITQAGGDRASFTVRAGLTDQLELVGMHHGFTTVQVTELDEAWVQMTFEVPGGEDRP